MARESEESYLYRYDSSWLDPDTPDETISVDYLESLRRQALLRGRSANNLRNAPLLDFLRDEENYKTRFQKNHKRRSELKLPTVTRFLPIRTPTASSDLLRQRGSVYVDETQISEQHDIKQSVDHFLRAPRLSQIVQHPTTQRNISFAEVGDPSGHAVFCCVGMGMTRYTTVLYDELAASLNLRLITPERPGIGDSDAWGDISSAPIKWPDDILAICSALKIHNFSLIAHSAGTIYALSTALRVPEQVFGTIHLLAPWIPPSQLSTIGKNGVTQLSAGSLTPSQKLLRVIPTSLLKAASFNFSSGHSRRIKSPDRCSSEKGDCHSPTTQLISHQMRHPMNDHASSLTARKLQDTKVLNLAISDVNALSKSHHVMDSVERQRKYEQCLTRMTWDLATRKGNALSDLFVCLERSETIGFKYCDITRAIVIHHGSKDKRVPLENVEMLGKVMQNADIRIHDGEGHSLMTNASVIVTVLMEIKEEWDNREEHTRPSS